MARLIGTLGTDWLRKQGFRGTVTDETMRSWRDFLEDDLSHRLSVDADLTLGEMTMFRFVAGDEDGHTITEIESFARKSLDNFLNKQQSV